MHHTDAVDAGKDKKPEIILDYNSTKGGVDTADQLIRTYSAKRKSNRWPVVFFFNLIDIAALNGLIVWILNNPARELERRFKRRLYLKQLARSLVEPWIKVRASQPQSGQVRRAAVHRWQLIFKGLLDIHSKLMVQEEDVFSAERRTTERHSTDAGHAINQSAYLIVHQWSIILVNNAFKNKSDHSKP